MHRRLGRFELAQVLTDEYAPFNVVVVVRLEPGPGPEALREALDALQRRHPPLAARLVKSGGVYAFETDGTPPIPLALAARHGDDDWRAAAERELNTRLDVAAGPLLRLTYLQAPEGGGRADLVLTFQHAVMDATSGMRLVHELLTRCAAGAGAEAEERPALPPVETRFPAAYQGVRRLWRYASFMARQMVDEAVYRWRMAGVRRPPVEARARNRILTFNLPREVTRALVRRCRRQRLSLASALSAALLLAVARRLYGGRTVALRHFVFPNLRPYLRPPVADDDLAGGFALLRLTTRLNPAHGLWELARRLNRQTLASLKRGDKYLAVLLSPWVIPWMLRSARQRMGHAALSYTGPHELAASYGAMRVLGLHAFVSNVPLGPEYTAQARLAGGRLWWDVVYLDADFDRAGAREVAEEIRALLEVEVRSPQRSSGKENGRT